MPVDPNAIATWANAVTVGRILCSPLVFVVFPDGDAGSWIALVTWFLLCVSDGFDGFLARRHGLCIIRTETPRAPAFWAHACVGHGRPEWAV